MCPNYKCEGRGDCFRYLAVPSEWRQAYTIFKPEEGQKTCNQFLNVKLWDGYKTRSIVQVDNALMNKKLMKGS